MLVANPPRRIGYTPTNAIYIHFFVLVHSFRSMIDAPMKKLMLMFTFLLCTFPMLFAGTNPDAQQLLTTAMQQADIFDDKVGPLQLEVDFVAQMQVPMQGHLTLKRGAKDQWWRRVVMGNFEQVDIRNGEKVYIVRNGSFTPTRIRELTTLLQFAHDAEGLSVTKQKRSTENGMETTCLQVKVEHSRMKPYEICVNPDSKEIMAEIWQADPDEHRRKEYSEYFEFAGHRWPRKFVLWVNGSKVVTATVTSLTATPFDQALLTSAPPGAIERRECAGMKRPVPVKTPDPQYPMSARENRIMGDVTLAITVLADGSVGDIQIIGHSAQSMDEAPLKTLKGWKFKPAMCGTEPVVSDIEVVVNFRLD